MEWINPLDVPVDREEFILNQKWPMKILEINRWLPHSGSIQKGTRIVPRCNEKESRMEIREDFATCSNNRIYHTQILSRNKFLGHSGDNVRVE